MAEVIRGLRARRGIHQELPIQRRQADGASVRASGPAAAHGVERCDGRGHSPLEERTTGKGLARHGRFASRTDNASWGDKSWVVGVRIGTASKAYAWNQSKERRIINDMIGQTPIVLVLAADQQSFAAFERLGEAEHFTGRALTQPAHPLKRVEASQEFWHSWRTFQPHTQQYR
jgi:hypothetical protein